MPGIQPSLRDLGNSKLVPGVETPGYFQMSLRDEREEGAVIIQLPIPLPRIPLPIFPTAIADAHPIAARAHPRPRRPRFAHQARRSCPVGTPDNSPAFQRRV